MDRIDQKLSDQKPAAPRLQGGIFLLAGQHPRTGRGAPNAPTSGGETFMKKLRVGISLVLALSLLVSTLAPTTALALGGKPIKPIENDDPPTPQVEETGDPDPDPSGLTIGITDFGVWRELFLVSLRVQFSQLYSIGRGKVSRDRAAYSSFKLRAHR